MSAELTIEDSPVGPLRLAASERGLTDLLFARHIKREPRGDDSGAARRILDSARRQLVEYFAGTRRTFELPLHLRGTDFQLQVWQSLGEIPFGETMSYSDLARRICRPRAEGGANGANPVSIIELCHRVIGRDGRLTGYGGGLGAKERLLALEARALSSGRLTRCCRPGLLGRSRSPRPCPARCIRRLHRSR